MILPSTRQLANSMPLYQSHVFRVVVVPSPVRMHSRSKEYTINS